MLRVGLVRLVLGYSSVIESECVKSVQLYGGFADHNFLNLEIGIET